MSPGPSSSSAAAGLEQASRVLTIIRTGDALPDHLHATLQQIRALGDGERLRSFTRAVQVALEVQS